jgi:hypothetical protein
LNSNRSKSDQRSALERRQRRRRVLRKGAKEALKSEIVAGKPAVAVVVVAPLQREATQTTATPLCDASGRLSGKAVVVSHHALIASCLQQTIRTRHASHFDLFFFLFLFSILYFLILNESFESR